MFLDLIYVCMRVSKMFNNYILYNCMYLEFEAWI